MDTKICTKCQQELPATIEYFHKCRKENPQLRSECRACRSSRKPKETVADGFKICARCKEHLPATPEFFYKDKSRPSGYKPECTNCNKEYKITRSDIIKEQEKAFRVRHNERIKQNKNEKYKDPKVKYINKVSQIKLDYSITPEAIQLKMDMQKGCCEICRRSLVFPHSKKSYCIDHNHSTGEVRGLLCNHCNTAIGYLKEDKELLTSAIRYLEKYNG